MSSITYTLSQFTSICNATPEEALAIIKSDIWFESNKENSEINRYVKFTINDSQIIFVNRSNNSNYEYIKVDKNIKIEDLTIHTKLTIEELTSIIFSVNGNYKIFNILKNFFVKLKINESSNFERIMYNKKMKIFCAHVAYLISNIEYESQIPDWLLEDSLFSEEIKMYESIHFRKFNKSDIPLFDNYEKLFMSPLYLSYMFVYDKAKDMNARYPTIPSNISKILKGIVIDLNKANNILKLI